MIPKLPETCRIALKEWLGICDALSRGRQSLLLRKGGLDERPGGFRPEHEAFWLYPTHVHEAQQGLKAPIEPLASPSDQESTIALRSLAVVTDVHQIDRLDVLHELRDFHVWTDETVTRRFHYRTPGLWALVVRVFPRDQAHHLDEAPELSGCTSWLTLPRAFPTTLMRPVIDDATHQNRLDEIRARMANA